MDESDADGTDHADVDARTVVEGRFADAPLPESVLGDVERLTRLAHRATVPAEREAYLDRREALLDEYGYTARVREADDTLVCHPADWLEDGTVRTERIDDLSAGVEIPLSGPGEPDDWDELDEHNRELVDRVRANHGDVHAANVDRFADFMGNHCAKPVTAATGEEVERFLSEYYVRNAWPEDHERAVVVDSIERLFAVADRSPPAYTPPAWARSVE